MDWLQIVLISYFILSITNLVDKIFLSKVITESTVYMLWVNIMSVIAVAVIALLLIVIQTSGFDLSQFGYLSAMPPLYLAIAIIVGILFTSAIYFLYSALQTGEASRVIPLIGGSMPIFTFAMTFYYAPLASSKLLAFVILVAGTILISLIPKSKDSTQKRSRSGIWRALAASLSFAAVFVLSQFLFREQGFINGMIWPRLGSVLMIIVLLAYKPIRDSLRKSFSDVSLRNKSLWLTNQSFNALGFVGQQYAISLPGVSVALVTALLGVQYSFVLIFATILSFVLPSILKERIAPKVIVQKIIAILLIAIGLYFAAT